MVADMNQHKKILAPSWEQFGFMTLIKAAGIPACLPIIVIAGFYVWYVLAGEPISSTWYSVLLFVGYVVSFALIALFLLRSYQLNKYTFALVMGFCGFLSGLCIAIVKLFVFFEPWTIFRLIAEPVFTALFAGVLGALLLWGKFKLPSNPDKGIL